MIGFRRGPLGPVLGPNGKLFATNGRPLTTSKNLIVVTANDDANTVDERFVHH
jgi:hypothetical protein